MLKMKIEQIMKTVNSRSGGTIERDIEIVLTYFGLGLQPYPTFESIAEEFGVSTRQRAKQIVSDKFLNKIQQEELGLVHTMSQLIERNDVSYVDEWIEQLHQQGLVNGPVHVRGLFGLL